MANYDLPGLTSQSLIANLLSGPEASTPDPAPDLSFASASPVGSLLAPSAHSMPSADEYPQYQPPPPPMQALIGGPEQSWKEILVRSLAAGLGSYGLSRAGIDPLRAYSAASDEMQQHALDDYKAQLANAEMLRRQRVDEEARRQTAIQEAQLKLEKQSQALNAINSFTTPQEIVQWKAAMGDLLAPFGVDVSKLPSTPSTGALMKLRTSAQNSVKATLETLKSTGHDMNDPATYQNASVSLVPGGPALKLNDAMQVAFGLQYDPAKMPMQSDDKLTGMDRQRADALAFKLYGVRDYHKLSYDELNQITRDAAEARHISVNVGQGGGADATEDLAQQVARNMLLPSQLSKRTGNYNAVLARADKILFEKTGKHLNVPKLEADYRAALKWASTMNGSQMLRYNGLAESVSGTIAEVQRLGDILQQGGVQLWNRAKRTTLTQLYGNTPYSQVANDYMVAVNTLKEEFANLANGGYAPTDAAWKLANEQINGDFGVKDLTSSLGEVDRLINVRSNAINTQPIRSAYGGYAVPVEDTSTPLPQTPAVSHAPAPTGYARGTPLKLRNGQTVYVVGRNPDGSYATSTTPPQ